MQSLQDGFKDSFWVPPSFSSSHVTASTTSTTTDTALPNYSAGVTKLFDRLKAGIVENETIIKYIHSRINTERACANIYSKNSLLSQHNMPTENGSSGNSATIQQDNNINASLKGAFTMLCNETTEAAHAHRVCANLMEQDVLEPLSNFTGYFEEQLVKRKAKIEDEIHDFEHAAQAVLLLRSVYWSRCRALEIVSPDFRPPLPLGFYEEEDVGSDGENQYSDNEDSSSTQSDTFVGGRRRSSSVTSELNVDKGGVRLGRFTVVPYREVAQSVNRMRKMIEGTALNTIATQQKKYLGQRIFEWIRDYFASPPPTLQQSLDDHNVNIDTESIEICQHLITLKFLKPATMKDNGPFNVGNYYLIQQNIVDRYLRKTRVRRSVDQGKQLDGDITNDNDSEMTVLEVPFLSSSPSKNEEGGFMSSLFNDKKKKKQNQASVSLSATKAHQEMVEADKAYRKKIETLEQSRKRLEEDLLAYFDDMEQLEKERIETIKQAFMAMTTTLNGTIPILQETYNSISLVQEALKAEQDIQYIVEQNKLGPYCPKPYIYENYYYGAAIDQIFGVPLEEVAQIYGTYVPPIISKGLKLIEEGLRPDTAEEIWSKLLPMTEMNKVTEQLNNLAGSKLKKALEDFDNLNTLANIIRLYLLELPECLLTYDLYEPIKILYASQYYEDESRLLSISKLLATLPSPNYYTLKALSKHLHKIVKEMKTETLLNHLISNFAHILMRPRTITTVNVHDRHPKRFVRDLLTQYDTLFTKNMNLVQKSNVSRSAIVANYGSYASMTPTASSQSQSHQPPPERSTSTESTLRRTLFNILRPNSSIDLPQQQLVTKSGTMSPSVISTTSSGGPPIVPHVPTSITLFEDPEYSKDSDVMQKEKAEADEATDTVVTAQQQQKTKEERKKKSDQSNQQVHNSDDVTIRKEDADNESYKTNVSFMLDMEAQDDDAVEINTINNEVVSAVASPILGENEKNKTRSRSSTKDTLENIALDPFFED